MDVTDGILPAQMLKNPEKASGEERENYEEERRLFYVGATRAKSELYVFTTGKPHSFCKELLSHPVTCRVKRKGIPSTP